MTIGTIRPGGITVALTVLALIAGACTGVTTPPPGTPSPTPSVSPEPTAAGPVAVCELAYYTGEFGPYGQSLTEDVLFPIKEVINLDPPLGRTWETFHEDLGTVGEAQAARTCLEQHGAEIVVSIAHGYRTYRDFMMEWWGEKDSPLGPSVHGGAIPGNLGGKAAEPIFRAQGLDEALGMSGILYAEQIGAKKVVIFATQVEGFQLAADANQEAAEALGLNVLERIDAPGVEFDESVQGTFTLLQGVGAQEQARQHLGVDPVAEVVRVVHAVAGQVEVPLVPVELGPDGRQVGELHARPAK